MNDSSQLVLGLVQLADEFARVIKDWPTLREELASLLLRLDDESQTVALRRDVDALLSRLMAHPAAGLLVRGALQTGQAHFADGRKRGSSKEETPKLQSAGAEIREGYVSVPVFYGTDRAMQDDPDPRRRYTGLRGTPGFGVARVSIPADHQVAQIEGPKWWKLEFHPNPTKHVTLLEVRPRDHHAFVNELSAALAAADAHDVLVFVHGYNVNFEGALRRTAQLAIDLKFPGRALLYSWPSEGDAKRYFVDEANVEWSTPHFLQFLRTAMTEVGAGTVHVIAHSMGNRALVGALERFDTGQLPSHSASLRQVIFAAPDVDADTFRELAGAFSGKAERCTLYASRNDKALLASQLLHRYSRAGDAGDGLVIVGNVDTVDASVVDTSLLSLGHSFFGEKRSILNDIFALIHEDTPPDKRFDLVAETCAAGSFWAYRP